VQIQTCYLTNLYVRYNEVSQRKKAFVDYNSDYCETRAIGNYTLLLPKSIEDIRMSHIMGAAIVPNIN
jgi:hypothetical protein